MLLSEFLQGVAEQGVVTPDDVAELQIIVAIGDLVDRAGIETILAVDMALQKTCPQWEEFLKKIIVGFLTGQNRLLSVENANWLMRSISRHGFVDDHERFELLVRVIETSQNASEPLVLLALKQVVEAVVNGQGPLAYAKSGDRNVLSRTDVDLVRRILVNARNHGKVPLSQREMAMLFELNEQTLPHANHSSWQKLFSRAVSNFVLSEKNALAENRASALSDTSVENLDEKIELCLAQFENLQLSPEGQKKRCQPYDMAVNEVPAKWIVKRLQRNLAFENDDAGLMSYVSRLTSREQYDGRANVG